MIRLTSKSAPVTRRREAPGPALRRLLQRFVIDGPLRLDRQPRAARRGSSLHLLLRRGDHAARLVDADVRGSRCAGARAVLVLRRRDRDDLAGGVEQRCAERVVVDPDVREDGERSDAAHGARGQVSSRRGTGVLMAKTLSSSGRRGTAIARSRASSGGPTRPPSGRSRESRRSRRDPPRARAPRPSRSATAALRATVAWPTRRWLVAIRPRASIRNPAPSFVGLQIETTLFCQSSRRADAFAARPRLEARGSRAGCFDLRVLGGELDRGGAPGRDVQRLASTVGLALEDQRLVGFDRVVRRPQVDFSGAVQRRDHPPRRGSRRVLADEERVPRHGPGAAVGVDDRDLDAQDAELLLR